MNIIYPQDIEEISSAVKSDRYLSELCSQKAAISDHRKNILNSNVIITQQIKDCFFSFLAELIQKETHTYHKFINAAFPEQAPPNDKTVHLHFERFKANINQLEKQFKDNNYTPPFVSYITESVISNRKANKQAHRNYEYKFFNARSFYYIMQNMECLPYLHKSRILPVKEWRKFFDLFLETNVYPFSEKVISQYCIDYYFNTLLFTQTLRFFEERPVPPFYKITEYDSGLYWEYFLFLCTLLQASSGMYAKQELFYTFKQIFFEPEISKNRHTNYLSLFNGSCRECFKQCAIELVFYNEIIYPYIKNLYHDKFNALLEKRCPPDKKSDYEKILTMILDTPTNADLYNLYISAEIEDIREFSFHLSESDFPALNYIAQKFYNDKPTLLDKNYQSSKSSYSEIAEELSLFLEIRFYNIQIEYDKNAGFPI